MGQRYYMLFNVSNVAGVNVNQAYIMFTVSQYDSYSYLFYQPTFISLDPTAKPTSIPLSGLRIGINGTIPLVGQAYIPLNTTITAANYTAARGCALAGGNGDRAREWPADRPVLPAIRCARHPEKRDRRGHPAAGDSGPGPPMADVGVRTFAQVNSTLSRLTGVPTNNTSVVSTYQNVQQQLPAINTLEAYSSANQVGVAQLAVQYCAQVMASPALQSAMFPGVNFSNPNLLPGSSSSITGPLAQLAVGGGSLASQPAAATVSTELNNLIGILCSGSAPCNNTARVQCGDGCRLRGGARQRRRVDRLTR